jgi:hypothetical protein
MQISWHFEVLHFEWQKKKKYDKVAFSALAGKIHQSAIIRWMN